MPTNVLSGSRAGIGSAVVTSSATSLTSQIVGVGTVYGPATGTLPPPSGHLNFPDSPTVAQVFTQAGMSWVWDGVAWQPLPHGSGSSSTGATVSDTAPASPSVGNLWFDSAGAQLYVWVNDGTSSQWVAASSQPVSASSSLLLRTVEDLEAGA